MILVGLVSAYKEGRLVQGAIRSALTACDHVFVLEGPAGEPLDADVPPTDLGPFADDPRVTYREGRWRTDSRKRQAMLEWSRRFEPPVWGVIVDADEVLMHGEYLHDWLLRLEYAEQCDPEARYLGRPMRIMELDGSLAWVRGRLLRLDRIQKYEVSTSVFVNELGIRHGEGNVIDKFSDWQRPRMTYIEEDRMLVMPPLPTEPFLVHRSMLRHPLRSGLRLHEQEKAELIRAGLPVTS